MWNPWTILGVVPGASARQVRAAWRRGVSQWHPDRNPSPEATRRLQQINAAYASIRAGAVPSSAGPAWSLATGSVLSGLSGTVIGEAYAQAANVARDCTRASIEIPALGWLLDEPITLAIPCIAGVFTLMTLLHPGELHDGSMLVFRGAGLSPAGLATDLVVTIRVALPAMPQPEPAPLSRCAQEMAD